MNFTAKFSLIQDLHNINIYHLHFFKSHRMRVVIKATWTPLTLQLCHCNLCYNHHKYQNKPLKISASFYEWILWNVHFHILIYWYASIIVVRYSHFCQHISNNFTIFVLCYIRKLNERKTESETNSVRLLGQSSRGEMRQKQHLRPG